MKVTLQTGKDKSDILYWKVCLKIFSFPVMQAVSFISLGILLCHISISTNSLLKTLPSRL